jgi:hypothetical protein
MSMPFRVMLLGRGDKPTLIFFLLPPSHSTLNPDDHRLDFIAVSAGVKQIIAAFPIVAVQDDEGVRNDPDVEAPCPLLVTALLGVLLIEPHMLPLGTCVAARYFR